MIGQFEKIPFEQFKKDCWDRFGDEVSLQRAWEKITLPTRKGVGCAGYDILCPVSVKIMPESSMVIPTGIRVKLEDGWMLNCSPKFTLEDGFKIQVTSVDGIIDGYFYENSAHNGHITLRVSVLGNKPLNLMAGEAFAQGVFCPYGVVNG